MSDGEDSLPRFEALRSRDRAMFNAAWRAALPYFYGAGIRIARLRLPKADDADHDDLVSDIVADILRKMEDMRLPIDISTTHQLLSYLRTAVSNRAIDHLRKTRREVLVAEVPEPEQDSAPLLESFTVDEELTRKATLEAAIRALPPPQPDVVRLHYREGWALLKIAERLSLTYYEVHKHWHTALASLRRRLGPNF